MRAYLLSVSLHAFLVGVLVLVALLPHRSALVNLTNQVFLVASAPGPVVAAPAVPDSTEPAEAAGPTRGLSSRPAAREAGQAAVSQKPEESLSQRLAARLRAEDSPAWKGTAGRSGQGAAAQSAPGAAGTTAGRTGQSAPAQPAASGGGPTQVESEPGFLNNWYLAVVSRRLSERWNPNREGIAAIKRTVAVSFVITRDGRIRDIGLVGPSGDPGYDRSGLAAVAGIDFLPPLPADWGKDSLQVVVRFREK